MSINMRNAAKLIHSTSLKPLELEKEAIWVLGNPIVDYKKCYNLKKDPYHLKKQMLSQSRYLSSIYLHLPSYIILVQIVSYQHIAGSSVKLPHLAGSLSLSLSLTHTHTNTSFKNGQMGPHWVPQITKNFFSKGFYDIITFSEMN